MSGHSIEYVREWLGEQEAESPNAEIVDHIRAVLSIADRVATDIGKDKASMNGANDPVRKMAEDIERHSRFVDESRNRDRYHYALSQLVKARDYLLQGMAAAAMDALHRAMDGIIEE